MIRARTRWRLAAALGASWLILGCSPDPRAKGRYVFTAPAGWTPLSPAERSKLVLSGEVFEAYSLNPGAFAILGTEFAARTKAAELVVQMHYLLLNLPTLKIQSEAEVSIAGVPAARVDVTADGDGKSIAPTTLGRPPTAPAGTALVPTRRVWIKVPRGHGYSTLELMFHCPEADFERRKPELEAALASFKIEA